jgi:hypothetical protein
MRIAGERQLLSPDYDTTWHRQAPSGEAESRGGGGLLTTPVPADVATRAMHVRLTHHLLSGVVVNS